MAYEETNKAKYILDYLIINMITALNDIFKDYININHLSGPFLGKELRVSSRHRRNYILRSSYIILLLFFVIIPWLNLVEYSGSVTFQKSRFAEAGKEISATIVWFQFIATQLIAVIMFCNSISDEIYHRTLGVLLTSPVNSFQIVIGKLMSKLFQILLLLSISLPLLAIVRLFGGVSWSYILSSLCITFSAVILAGSISLFFSMLFRKSFVVIVLTFSALGVLFGLMPFVVFRLSDYAPFKIFLGPETSFLSINPYLLLYRVTEEMKSPGSAMISMYWIYYCVIILFASFVILFISACLLRKITLAYTFKSRNVLKNILNLRKIDYLQPVDSAKSESKIRHVWGSPVVWKEMITRFSSREKLFVALIICTEVIMIIAMYLFPYIAVDIGYEEAHMLYLCIFMGLGILSIVIFSPTCIASEKEARTWPLLMITTLKDWEILYGKFVGILRRSLPIWIMLLIYFCPFLDSLRVGVFALLLMIMLIIAVIIFLSGAGLYFSSLFRRTNNAVLTNLVFISSIWILIPYIGSSFNIRDYLAPLFNPLELDDIYESLLKANPFMQAHAIIGINSNSLRYYRMGWIEGYRGLFESFQLMIKILMAYITIGLIFIWRAKRRFRRNIF